MADQVGICNEICRFIAVKSADLPIRVGLTALNGKLVKFK